MAQYLWIASLLLMLCPQFGCIPVAAGAVAGGIAAGNIEERQDEKLRLYFVTLRRHDGASDAEIAAEIRDLDREWFEDYVLADQDLEQSLKHQNRASRYCSSVQGKQRRSRSVETACREAREAERKKFEAAGIDW